jgi:hypothetical protein
LGDLLDFIERSLLVLGALLDLTVLVDLLDFGDLGDFIDFTERSLVVLGVLLDLDLWGLKDSKIKDIMLVQPHPRQYS